MYNLGLVCVQVIDCLNDLAQHVKDPVPVPRDVRSLEHVQEAALVAILERKTETRSNANTMEANDTRTLHQTSNQSG